MMPALFLLKDWTRVMDHALPEDAIVRSIEEEDRYFVLLVESELFTDGQEIASPVFTTSPIHPNHGEDTVSETTTGLQIVETPEEEYRDPLEDLPLQTRESDPVGFRSVRYPHDGEPMLRHRSQVERTLALLVEAWALVNEANYSEPISTCTTAGEVVCEQSGAEESLGFAVQGIGFLLHQDGDFLVVGYEIDSEEAERQRSANRELVEHFRPAEAGP